MNPAGQLAPELLGKLIVVHRSPTELHPSRYGWKPVNIERNSRCRLDVRVSVIGYRQRTCRPSVLRKQSLIARRDEYLRSVGSELTSTETKEAILNSYGTESSTPNRTFSLCRILGIQRAIGHCLFSANASKHRRSRAGSSAVTWGS